MATPLCDPSKRRDECEWNYVFKFFSSGIFTSHVYNYSLIEKKSLGFVLCCKKYYICCVNKTHADGDIILCLYSMYIQVCCRLSSISQLGAGICVSMQILLRFTRQVWNG